MKRIALGLAAVVVPALIFHAAILAALGGYLVKAGPPEKADIALVLGGDPSGNRILKAGEMVRQGFVPKVLVSGPVGMYDYAECDLEIPFAVHRGYPESYFVHFEHRARSTTEEAAATIPELRRLGAKTVLLITSDYHTRRSGRTFRHAAPDLTFYVVAAPDPFFTADAWWKNREGRKTFVMEWMKTVAEWLGI